MPYVDGDFTTDFIYERILFYKTPKTLMNFD